MEKEIVNKVGMVILTIILIGSLIAGLYLFTPLKGTLRRAVGMKPTWKAFDTENTTGIPQNVLNKPQCAGIGIDNPYTYSCMWIGTLGREALCYDLKQQLRYNEVDECVQIECLRVPVEDPDAKKYCEWIRNLT